MGSQPGDYTSRAACAHGLDKTDVGVAAYNPRMETRDKHRSVVDRSDRHLANVADNLQLLADLGYADVALAMVEGDSLRVVADSRPVTAVAAVASTRVGRTLPHRDEPEAYEALRTEAVVRGSRRRTTRGISYTTTAYPIGVPVRAVVLRDLTQQVAEAPGKMETVFMQVTEDILGRLREGPLLDLRSGEPFSTSRHAGDGLMRVDEGGVVEYASPNAVNILALAGADTVVGAQTSALPGGAVALGPLLQSSGALDSQVEFGGRFLNYRAISLPRGAFAFVADITEVRRHAREIKVKEATIREVHHRVKNNLQTIASLLRIQARRTGSQETARSLAEAVERVSAMAVVHEMLAGAADENVDFTDAAGTVVDMVRQGLAGGDSGIRVEVEGASGEVPASVATSLALVTAELVHNAIEHGLAGAAEGLVTVSMRRLPEELHLVVRDTGRGLPADFDVRSSANLGLAIVKTVVEDDLRGTLAVRAAKTGAHGTTVTIRIPLPSDSGHEATGPMDESQGKAG